MSPILAAMAEKRHDKPNHEPCWWHSNGWVQQSQVSTDHEIAPLACEACHTAPHKMSCSRSVGSASALPASLLSCGHATRSGCCGSVVSGRLT